jgi:hypothetical protein
VSKANASNEIYEAGRSAVRLLKNLIAETPLRSDTPKIKAEIARIEGIFGQEGEHPPGAGLGA